MHSPLPLPYSFGYVTPKDKGAQEDVKEISNRAQKQPQWERRNDFAKCGFHYKLFSLDKLPL